MKLLFLTIALLAAGIVGVQAQTKLKVGDPAPKVEGKNMDDDPWKLENYVGKKIVLLYFYPKDDTPGCTKQACGLRDRGFDFQRDGVEVVGVSFDDANSHRAFMQKYDLNFTLVPDTEGKIADAFGARREPGKKIAKRMSFLIGKDGKIKHITDSPSADVHLAEMKDAVEKLKKEEAAKKS